jgi:hypothetical protein
VLPPMRDIDTREDLTSLAESGREDELPNVRAWLRS